MSKPSQHFVNCPDCGGLFDLRDLRQVLKHERCKDFALTPSVVAEVAGVPVEKSKADEQLNYFGIKIGDSVIVELVSSVSTVQYRKGFVTGFRKVKCGIPQLQAQIATDMVETGLIAEEEEGWGISVVVQEKEDTRIIAPIENVKLDTSGADNRHT